MRRYVRRVSDGAVFEVSYPSEWDTAPHANPFVTLLASKASGTRWYFRAGRFVRRWWWPFRLWERTGEVWQPREYRSQWDGPLTKRQAMKECRV